MGLDCLITFISEHKFYICHAFLIVIVPDLQESVYERMKKSGGATPFNLFVISEMECMHRLLAAVRETLLVSELCYSLSCSWDTGLEFVRLWHIPLSQYILAFSLIVGTSPQMIDVLTSVLCATAMREKVKYPVRTSIVVHL